MQGHDEALEVSEFIIHVNSGGSPISITVKVGGKAATSTGIIKAFYLPKGLSDFDVHDFIQYPEPLVARFPRATWTLPLR